MIKDLLDQNETVVWEGQPDKATYVIGSPFLYVFAMIWGAFDFVFISLFLKNGTSSAPRGISLVLIPFFLIHLMPVWIAVFGPVYRAANWKTIHYVITERRVYIESGLIGHNINSIDFSDIDQPEVTVGFIERLRHCGTIRLSPHIYLDRRNRQRNTFRATLAHIEAPYDIYKLINHITDVTRNGPVPVSDADEEGT